MSEEKITIRLPNAREKLLTHFPQDNRGDIRIIIGQKMFKLQKAFLRLESGYFKKIFAQQTADMIEIKEPFNVLIPRYSNNIFQISFIASMEPPFSYLELKFWSTFQSLNSSKFKFC